MKSSKQKREELAAKRRAKDAKRAAKLRAEQLATDARQGRVIATGPPVNREALKPHNSYGEPDFVTRGFYVDTPFTCIDCGKSEVWTATQQKWWYEVAKGDVFTTARRCRPCRQREQRRKAEARRTHLEGLARKRAQG